MAHYNVLFLYRDKKRYQFEKSFPLRSMAEIYAQRTMNESIVMKHLIKGYKITTSPFKRY